MAFHVVYSRHYWDYEDGNGTFDNSWTIYRNVPYSELFKMKDAIPSLKENADQVYADYEAKRDFKTDPKQFYKSEVFIVLQNFVTNLYSGYPSFLENLLE